MAAVTERARGVSIEKTTVNTMTVIGAFATIIVSALLVSNKYRDMTEALKLSDQDRAAQYEAIRTDITGIKDGMQSIASRVGVGPTVQRSTVLLWIEKLRAGNLEVSVPDWPKQQE